MTDTRDITVNVAIIGSVSAGKSTLLNALFGKTLSDMKIKRTTMIPQIYSIIDSKTFEGKVVDEQQIRSRNSELNNQYRGQFPRMPHVEYRVEPFYDFIDFPEGCNLKIHDLPGINDANTKRKYMEYIAKQFSNYDIVVLVIDINSSLNTSDELDIIRLLKKCYENNKRNGITTKIIAAINKCDAMDNTQLEGEHRELYQDINCILVENGLKIPMIPTSFGEAYIFRTIQRNPDYKLDKKYVDKLGSATFGLITWKSKSESEQSSFIKTLSPEIITKGIELSGFENFKTQFRNLLSGNNLLDIFHNKYVTDIVDLLDINIDNCDDFSSQMTSLEKTINLMKKLATDNNICYEYLQNIFSKYIEKLREKWLVYVKKYIDSINYLTFFSVKTFISELNKFIELNQVFVCKFGTKYHILHEVNTTIYKEKLEIITNVLKNNKNLIINNFDHVIYLFSELNYQDGSDLSKYVMTIKNWHKQTDEDVKKFYDYFHQNFHWSVQERFDFIADFLLNRYKIIYSEYSRTSHLSYIYWSLRIMDTYHFVANFENIGENNFKIEQIRMLLLKIFNNKTHDDLQPFNASMILELCKLKQK